MAKGSVADFRGETSEAATAASAALADLQRSVSPQLGRLASHSLYEQLDTIEALRVFLEHHVFAVWDFMCLLKALQHHLTCTDILWRPTGTATGRRLINAMVLEEESDEIDDVPTSHFEIYLQAMREAGADLEPITHFLEALTAGLPLDAALKAADVPAASCAFVRTTFALIGTDRPAVVCAAFTFGREQAVPDVFGALLDALPGGSARVPTLDRYLRRHIQLDGEDHGPKALALLATICGTDAALWIDAAAAARSALEARIALWSGIGQAIAAADASASRRSDIPFRTDGGFRFGATSIAAAASFGCNGREAAGHAGD